MISISTVLCLCIFARAWASTFSDPIQALASMANQTTITLINAEGLALLEMAAAIPGLKTLVGNDTSYSGLYLTITIIRCTTESRVYDLEPFVSTFSESLISYL